MTLRWQRLRLAWVLAPPFLLLCEPTPSWIVIGAVIAVPGLALRALAAASILKDRVLAIRGPYAHLRHPLYVGSFFLGLGVVVGGGRWGLVALYMPLFLWVYGRTIRAEERSLAMRFGAAYRRYRERVPAFFPRRMPYEGPGMRVESEGWGGRNGEERERGHLALYRRNKEWQALLGAMLAFALLWVKVAFPLAP